MDATMYRLRQRHANRRNKGFVMSKNKGKPSGRIMKGKGHAGRRLDLNHSGWPEDVPTQHVQDATATQPGSPFERPEALPGSGEGRNLRAGSPI